MPGFFPGAPYFFVCKSCGHKFCRKIKLGIMCPKCKSLKVQSDLPVCK
ncbi:hypothetical protein VST7929_01987 [Vibrio stylophorae]|uniref:Com family DNA-binding transcriptional regulator n=1 Tax=Vibrio stylophorae TaxID=659351 RepID=A0ABN8DVP7_9VIBR|nr:hypothetical protein VST7929_01987 [Vibrio stylophorae]